VTQAGLIAYIGCCEGGVGLCLNTLPAPGRPFGVPHYCLVRRLYQARTLDDAVAIVHQTERAIPANVMLSLPDGPADLEVTLDGVHVLRDGRRVTHTNHGRHPDLSRLCQQFPELIQSDARQARVDLLLAGLGDDLDAADLMTVLRDHEQHPRSICRHVNDDVPTGFWQTVFSVIIEPDAGRLFLARGTPCDHPYEEYHAGS
jgi:isopenicillin-N N-acyltransferase-like protein